MQTPGWTMVEGRAEVDSRSSDRIALLDFAPSVAMVEGSANPSDALVVELRVGTSMISTCDSVVLSRWATYS